MPKLGAGASKKAQAGRMKEELGKFKRGEMHSGSKSGPTVKNPAQAKAIALSEAGLSNRSKKRGAKRSSRKRT